LINDADHSKKGDRFIFKKSKKGDRLEKKGTDLFLRNREERGEADLFMSGAHNFISTQVKDPCV
jgi:hypothetical protein